MFPTDPPTPARWAALRIQGRLITKNISPYNFDNKEDIINIFTKLNNNEKF